MTQQATDAHGSVRVRPFALVGAFLRRDFSIALSYRLPFFVDLVNTMSSLVLFFFLARFVDQATVAGSTFASEPLEKGYFPFVVLGIALLGILQTGLTAFDQRIRMDQSTGTLEALLATPPQAWVTVLASSAYQLAYATVSSVLYIAVAAFLFGVRFDVQPLGVAVAVVGLLATVLLFAALGMVLAAVTVVFKRAGGVIGLVTTGLALLAGVYYPLEVLPRPLEVLGRALPFTWSVDLIRDCLLEAKAPVGQLATLLTVAVLTTVLAVRVFSGAIDVARRSGTLGQY